MEHIRTPKVENVRMIDRLTPRKSTVGTLYLSSTHTIFVENSEARKETWVLHSLVYNVERLPTNPSGSPVIIRCKNFHIYRLLIPQEKDCLDVVASLTRLSRPELREKAWGFIDLKAEFSRMGIPSNLWHVMAANHEYRLCDTYPSELFVPKSASPAVIVGSAKFRSRGRLPVLSYFHRDTSASICRSSQPLSGFSARSSDDEQLLQAIMKSNPVSEFMYVVDTRPKVLIEKDWVSFGHKFSHRYAHIDSDPKEVSPVMDQFLECVWQLMQQFPCAFEFNERFLIQLHTHIYSCQYGNFIGNCQKERRDLRFWKGMYGRAEKSVASHQSPADCLNAVREESQQLEEELSTHQERLAQLKERKISGEMRKTNKLSERVRRPIPTERELGSPLDYFTTPRSEKHTPSFTLPLELAAPPKNGDPDDLSTCSDFESGVADLSSHSSSAGDDEVVKTNG
ncbi:myotubularin-related 7-like isoform X1 [Labeo rohita]|uniref:Myotubularin-related 7-like isoform X1 n=1 Tax=Labeo rohita TaxID=84645 RepID=A0A498N4N8_LABRO|nr:myotubularin-related 7-like isoform X1 [Labeo rohita]RXN30676.1 myotubularin-related 7-like isoform X1 [Labeo rohita]